MRSIVTAATILILEAGFLLSVAATPAPAPAGRDAAVASTQAPPAPPAAAARPASAG